ncbi:MAG: hypothetical protein RDV41_06635 [Planctomycetota bacterium]|nr:hypothetical protein [Planctomycetota bacterium]
MHSKRWVLLLAAVVVVGLSGLLQAFWIDNLPETGEMFAANPFGVMPHPDIMANYILTNLLGGFKGIAINMLWMQFLEHKNREEFVELLPVLDLISKLQPNLEEVWKHLAWEKAYNIANLAQTPEEKLKWVLAGLDHIREGFSKNPKSWRLAWQIGYFYFHRVPQDPFILAAVEEKEGKDVYEITLDWFLKAEDVAVALDKERGDDPLKSGGYFTNFQRCRNNTTGFLMETYAQHLARLVKREEYDRALARLPDAIRLCDKLISESVGVTDVHIDRRDSLIDTMPLYELEKRRAVAAAAGRPEAEGMRSELAEAYVTLIRKYHNINLEYLAFRLKYIFVLALENTYDLVRAGKAQEAANIAVKLADKARFILPREHRDYFFWDTAAGELAEFGKSVVPKEAQLAKCESEHDAAGARAVATDLLLIYNRLFEKTTWQAPRIVKHVEELKAKYAR